MLVIMAMTLIIIVILIMIMIMIVILRGIVIITNSGACGSGGAGWLQGPAPSKGNLTPRHTTGLPQGDKVRAHY